MVRRVTLPLLVLASACVHVYQGVRVRALDRTPVTVTSPVKAHLRDGSTVVFSAGAVVGGDTVRGQGMRYGLTLRDSTAIGAISLDSIVGMETFERTSNPAAGFAVTVLATAGTLLGAAALAVAIFGSCPTFYADSAGVAQLQAEGFSYSIAPIFESRDIDRLRVIRAADGSVRLEVRNEALETHYVNQLEILQVAHTTSETALVDEFNRVVAVSGEVPLSSARDRRGRDVSRSVAWHDGVVYSTDERIMKRGRVGDLDDWIDISAPAPQGADSVAIVLRLRNSLLNTILLYDVMLGDAGARSLDWVGQDLKQVGPALAVAQWYQERMGMHLAVNDGRRYRVVGHLRDTGPIAWKDVAVIVPVLTPDTVRVRLSFPMDNWRIDRVVVVSRYRRITPVVVPLVDVQHAEGARDTAALAAMKDADGRYLQTAPGQRFAAVFRANQAMGAGAHTFFLASQGYYTEWMRRSWLRSPRADRPFIPSDTALAQALSRWRTSQDSLETLFSATRIPVH